MSTLQQNSIKIKKLAQAPSPDEDKDFVCGECRRGYNSYPALRLHVKRRHNGIMPPNTKIVKTPRPALDVDVKSGRPLKQIKDIDELCKHDANIEMAENDLVSFLAEKLVVTSLFASKIPVTDIVDKILAIPTTDQDKWFLDIQEETKVFLNEHPEMRSKLIHLNFSEDFANLNFEKGLKVIVWVLIWLIQIYVRIEFTTELCLIFSKIWKVLQETELSVQDLDNKLVWKKVSKECENFDNLLIVNKDQNLLLVLIQKICQLIGKATEDKNVLDS